MNARAPASSVSNRSRSMRNRPSGGDSSGISTSSAWRSRAALPALGQAGDMHDHPVAGPHGGGKRDRQRRHARGGELDARLGHRLGVQLGEIGGERLAQGRDAAHVRVRRLACVQSPDQRVARRQRTRLVGFAEGQDVDAGGGECEQANLDDARAGDTGDVHIPGLKHCPPVVVAPAGQSCVASAGVTTSSAARGRAPPRSGP